MECFRLLFDHLAWIEHQFLSGIRDSRKAGIMWGMKRGVGRVRKSIHQSWLVEGLRLGLLCWGFKGVQQEIPKEEASTVQIGSVAFPPGQCTSPQFHPSHRLFEQDGHQDCSSSSLIYFDRWWSGSSCISQWYNIITFYLKTSLIKKKNWLWTLFLFLNSQNITGIHFQFHHFRDVRS